MIDVHCHYDMAESPEKYISENEKQGIITIGMTNLPSHFQIGMPHVKKYKYIRLAIGLHPLQADVHEKQYLDFQRLVNETSYIGEVGLDFSPEGYATKRIQIKSFKFVLNCIKDKPKIISLHSRWAERETLEMLIANKIDNAIFHWYSGSLGILRKIVASRYFVSINSAMIQSENGKKIISEIPKELALTETDFPHIKQSNISLVIQYLSSIWGISTIEVEKMIDNNFKGLVKKIS